MEPLNILVKKFYIGIEKIASLFRDHTIAVSNADRQAAIKLDLVSPNKISTIYNGIGKIDFLSSDQAKQVLKLPAKFTIGAIANFYHNKGLDLLIEALSKLNTDFCCVILGDGPKRKELTDLIKSHQLTTKIILCGSVPDAAKYLKAFDLFILPSRKEGMPFVVLEAMQAGLPIIATNVGATAEILSDAAIYIQPEPASITEVLSSILANPEQQKNLSNKSILRSQEFDIQKTLTETEKIYKELLGTPVTL